MLAILAQSQDSEVLGAAVGLLTVFAVLALNIYLVYAIIATRQDVRAILDSVEWMTAYIYDDEDAEDDSPAYSVETDNPVMPDDKTCPDCGEIIRRSARKCRYCSYQFL